MTSTIENRLRAMFDADAALAPSSDEHPVTLRAQGRQQHGPSARPAPTTSRPRLLVGGISIAAVCVVAVSAVALSDDGPGQPSRGPGDAVQEPRAETSASLEPAAPVPPGPSGAVPLGAQERCSAPYSAEMVAGTVFAADGVIRSIGAPGSGATGDPAFVSVTLQVREWFIGSGAVLVVDMIAPQLQASESTPPPYEIGTRLLISGFSQVAPDGSRALVGGGCGLIRYFDEQTATDWKRATG